MGCRSEEGLIENTRWAPWSVCRAIAQTCYLLSGVILKQIGRRAQTVGCQSKSQRTGYRLGLIVYDIVAVKIFQRYRNMPLPIRALQPSHATWRREPAAAAAAMLSWSSNTCELNSGLSCELKVTENQYAKALE